MTFRPRGFGPYPKRQASDKGNTEMEITIKLKDVYGETKAYPVCPKATAFANMLGTKT
jgi:hypothetical protein